MSDLNIGSAIKRLRREHDVTQEELANAIGVTSQAVSKWERENCIASLHKSADYCVMNDSFDLENGKPTSLLINRISYKGWDSRHQNTRENLLYDLTTETRYDSIRETPAFRSVLAKLTK